MANIARIRVISGQFQKIRKILRIDTAIAKREPSTGLLEGIAQTLELAPQSDTARNLSQKPQG